MSQSPLSGSGKAQANDRRCGESRWAALRPNSVVPELKSTPYKPPVGSPVAGSTDD
jgi:hypothetical protein